MTRCLCKPIFLNFSGFFLGKNSISRDTDIDSAKKGIGRIKTQTTRGEFMKITKYKFNCIQQEYSARYYLSGFSCILAGMVCWIIPDENGEAMLDSYSESVIWLHDILVELLDAGLITEDKYWYPYMTIFERLARYSDF